MTGVHGLVLPCRAQQMQVKFRRTVGETCLGGLGTDTHVAPPPLTLWYPIFFDGPSVRSPNFRLRASTTAFINASTSVSASTDGFRELESTSRALHMADGGPQVQTHSLASDYRLAPNPQKSRTQKNAGSIHSCGSLRLPCGRIAVSAIA